MHSDYKRNEMRKMNTKKRKKKKIHCDILLFTLYSSHSMHYTMMNCSRNSCCCCGWNKNYEQFSSLNSTANHFRQTIKTRNLYSNAKDIEMICQHKEWLISIMDVTAWKRNIHLQKQAHCSCELQTLLFYLEMDIQFRKITLIEQHFLFVVVFSSIWFFRILYLTEHQFNWIILRFCRLYWYGKSPNIFRCIRFVWRLMTPQKIGMNSSYGEFQTATSSEKDL